MTKDAQRNVLVTGDFFSYRDHYSDGPGGTRAVVRRTPGGAAFVQAFLEQAGPQASHPFSVTAVDPPGSPGEKPLLEPFSLWEPYPGDSDSAPVWRCSRRFGRAPMRGRSQHDASLPETAPDLMVIDDHGFRARYSGALLPWKTNPQWIVMRLVEPFFRGALWHELSRDAERMDRLVLVLSIRHLRKHDARVSQSVSWERTALDLVRELQNNPALNGLRQARHTVVSFSSEGCLWMERTSEGPRFRLVFDPYHVEGEWAVRQGIAGDVHGYMSAFTAAVVARLADAADADAGGMEDALRSGLAVLRTMRRLGHGATSKTTPRLPLAELAKTCLGQVDTIHFKAAHIPGDAPATEADGALWRLLESQALDSPRDRQEPLFGIAKQVALFGTNAALDAPIGRFGKLETADRTEIEAYRLLEHLIHDYRGDRQNHKPLAIAVFGPPGSGKSFGIKQIGKAILGKGVPILEFNLSQFSSPADLIGAFHQVRDCVLAGHCPMVFWDEFDSQAYQWLQFFLAPIQDGTFQEGQLTHPIGKCVFVFAGATSFQMKHFGPPPSDEAAYREFKLRKGPDFVSRISGHLDVLGPNPRLLPPAAGRGAREPEPDPTDICYPVRRAILLRVMLGLVGKLANDRLNIDRGLLAALLEVSAYRYGSRSLERILQSLQTQGVAGMYRRSDLPADAVLAANLDADDFMRIMTRNDRFQQQAAGLAPHIHEVYRKLSHEEQWAFRYDMPYDELPQAVKDDNIAAALRMPRILELVDLYLVAGGGNQTDPAVSGILEANIELLAEQEHDLWMRHKCDNGWRFAETRDDARGLHDCLVPYAKLSEKDRKKDRNSVRTFPRIAAHAAYKIVIGRPVETA